MIRARIVPLAFLLAASGVLAQRSGTSDNSIEMVVPGYRPAADCPLAMRASHGAGFPFAMNAGSVLNQDPTTPHDAPAQKIYLIMNNLLSHGIVSAQFVVHGFSAKQRAMNLGTSSPGSDLARTVNVVLNVKAKGEASSELWLSRFTAVTSIDLNSITFANGHTWHTPSPQACSVTPGTMMLLASTD